MDIEVASKLRKKIVDVRSRRRYYGELEKGISVALSSLAMAGCLANLTEGPPLYRHKLEGNFEGLWAIRVSVNVRMILRPLEGSDPRDIVRVCVEDIIDYH